MRAIVSSLPLLLAISTSPPALGAPAAAAELTSATARREAEARSPELRAAAAVVEEARGRLLRARTYPHNPAVELEGARRTGPEGSTTDRGIRLAQEVEIAGQRGKRTAAAQADLEAARARYERRRREVLAAVDRSFAETVRRRELLAVAQADLDLARGLLGFGQRRLEAGAGTQIEVNLARATTGRAVRSLQQATASWHEARARLAEVTGLDPSAPPTVVGELPAAGENLPSLDELTRRAIENRSDLEARRRERQRAAGQVELERALAVPSLDLGIFAAREEGDEILGLSAGIAIPLFDRNQGAIAEAEAAVHRADAEVAAADLAARREVAVAYRRYRAAADALDSLRALVVGTLEESLGLLRRAVEAGELSATEVLLQRRELVAGQREQIEAAGELWLARAELELAVGSDLVPAPAQGGGER